MMSKLRDVCYPEPVDAIDATDAINAMNTDANVSKPAALNDDTVPLLQFHVNHPLSVGRCRLPVSKPVLRPATGPALEATI